MARKKKAVKKVVKEPVVTDILRDYFHKDGVEKVKLTYMNGKKVVKTEVVEER